MIFKQAKFKTGYVERCKPRTWDCPVHNQDLMSFCFLMTILIWHGKPMAMSLSVRGFQPELISFNPSTRQHSRSFRLWIITSSAGWRPLHIFWWTCVCISFFFKAISIPKLGPQLRIPRSRMRCSTEPARQPLVYAFLLCIQKWNCWYGRVDEAKKRLCQKCKDIIFYSEGKGLLKAR